jgi:CheY-like chemotaxis protein
MVYPYDHHDEQSATRPAPDASTNASRPIAAAAGASAPEASEQVGVLRMASYPATILVVENEDGNRTLMEKILGFAGYRCVSATNGKEALKVFDRERPNMVLTDISMPVMDGFETIANIRARPGGGRVPIVAVTAHAMSGDRELALREGCDEYLAKPYRPHQLLDVVARLLREASI